MLLPKIKICGIRSPQMAIEAVMAGADYIGLVFHPNSKRVVSIAEAQTIATVVTACGAIPVAVFTEHSAQQMIHICTATQITTVQLHGRLAKQAHLALGSAYQRFYACSVSADGRIQDQDNGLDHCDPEKDYVLFDSETPGSGQRFDWQALRYSGAFRTIVAGGLRPDNVQFAIRQLQPAMVDVSSGVENHAGEKDVGLIRQLIQNIRGVK